MTTNDNDVSDWWRTSIIDMCPGEIRLRGYPIESLIGKLSFAQMIWLMTRGNLPGDAEAKLLEHALVAAVDHGPQAPAIATARMAVTCGLGMNGAMASAVNMLDDIHGGAGEQAVEFYQTIDKLTSDGEPLERAIDTAVEQWQMSRSDYIPGFGHRFHTPEDPRTPRLLSLVTEAVDAGVISGRFSTIAQAVQRNLSERKQTELPMNIDGATAVVYAELGFAGPLARGLFCMSRSVGIIAHAWEQMQQGGRNKGPVPPAYGWTYTGENPIKKTIE